MQKVIWAIIIAAVVIAGAWYFFFRDMGTPPSAESDLPETVATVNGEEISRDDFEEAEAQLIGGQGINLATLDAETRGVLRQQVLDTMIERALVHQAAAASTTTVEDAAIDAELASLKTQFGTDEAYQAALVAEALTEQELREQIREGLTTQAYLENTLQLSTIAVTDAEIEEMYQNMIVGVTDAPPLAEVREQVEAFVRGEKQQELVAQFVEQLRAEADVEVFI